VTRIFPQTSEFSYFRTMLLSSLWLACALTSPNPIISPSDTVPTQRAPISAPEDEREAREAQQVFRDHYKAESYALFKGHITQIDDGAYRLDSFTMRIDTLYSGMTGLLSRGLLYPRLLTPLAGSSGNFSIKNLHELKRVGSLTHVRRFSCWVFVSRMLNPTWYVFELTNNRATADMDMATFLHGARLTFLYQASIII
jgi:hypothetical protein